MMRIIPISLLLACLFSLQGKQKDPSGRMSHCAHIRSISAGLRDLPETGQEAKRTYPYQAALQEYIMTMDPENRKIPVYRRYDAVESALEIRHDRKLKALAPALNWGSLPANTGGRARALMFDPNDPEHKKVWAGAVTGGLWYIEDITDPAEEWQPVNDFWKNLAVGCICADPNDPMQFYAGTGEGQTAFVTYRESSGTGFGIMHSDDGGKNWDLLPSTTGFAYITDIVVRDENGTSVIYAGTKSGDYKGKIFDSKPDNGLYRSTDGGESWTQVLPDMPEEDFTYPVADIEISTSGRIFVGTTNNLDNECGGRILYSDDGLNWTVFDGFIEEIEDDEIFTIPGRVMLASSATDPQRVYALFGTGAYGTNQILYIYCRFMARSDDGGVTWTKYPVPSFKGDSTRAANWAYIAWHALTVAVDPEDPDMVYSGGCDLHRSRDGGETWEWISDTDEASLHKKNTCRYVHADQHTLIFRPGSRDYLLNVNDGGVFLTENARDSLPCWIERNENFNTMQYYTCAIHPGEGVTRHLGGTQDNSTMRYEGTGPVTDDGNRWLGGDGAYCFIDRDEPGLQIMSIQWNWYSFLDDAKDTLYDFPDLFRSGLFVNPADYDSRNNTLYGNATTQYGEHLDRIIVIRDIPDNSAGFMLPVNSGSEVPFSAVRLSPHSRAEHPVLYLGNQSGRLFKVHDAKNIEIWSEEIGSPYFPPANVSCIQVGRTEAELLVTFSNYGVASVWHTSDGGATWANKETNLPDIPIRWAIWHPQNRDHVLLATEVGTWSTDNFLSETPGWVPELEGLANVRVDMVQVRESDNTVIAASHGRGMYEAVWEAQPEDPVEPPDDLEQLRLFPNPGSGMLKLQYPLVQNQDILIMVYDHRGRKVYESSIPFYAGEFEKTLDLTGLAPGVYILDIEIGSLKETRQIVIAR